MYSSTLSIQGFNKYENICKPIFKKNNNKKFLNTDSAH